VHQISIYIHIYKNRKGKRKKKKKRVFFASWAGGFWPSRTRASGVVAKWAQTAHEERGRRDGRRGCGPTHQREEGDGVWGRRRAVHGGENRSPVNPTAVPHRWSGSEWTEWWQSTSGGRRSWRWSQFGRWTPRMAGPRRVAGSAAVRPPARPTGEIGEGKKVCRPRGEVAELKSYTSLT
jgi:hypothetical protein